MDIRQVLPLGVALSAFCAPAASGASPRLVATLERDNGVTDGPAAGLPGSAKAFPAEGGGGGADDPFRDVPLQSLTATRERPLFSATRRPPPSAAPVSTEHPRPAAQAPSAPEPEGPPLALIGTIVGAERPVAVLFNTLTRAVSTAHEGDETLGWRITTVSARSAIAEKDGVTVTLDLPRRGDPAATGPRTAPDPSHDP